MTMTRLPLRGQSLMTWEERFWSNPAVRVICRVMYKIGMASATLFVVAILMGVLAGAAALLWTLLGPAGHHL